MDAVDFGPCAKTKVAVIELFNTGMCAIDTPCFEILPYVNKNTNDINIGLTS